MRRSTLTAAPVEPSLADDLMAMDPTGGHRRRWSLGERVVGTVIAVGVIVLIVKVVPEVSAALSIVVAPKLSGLSEPKTRRRAPELPYSAWALLVDLVALLLTPVWWISDLFDEPEDTWRRMRDWWTADRVAVAVWVFLATALVIVALMGGL